MRLLFPIENRGYMGISLWIGHLVGHDFQVTPQGWIRFKVFHQHRRVCLPLPFSCDSSSVGQPITRKGGTAMMRVRGPNILLDSWGVSQPTATFDDRKASQAAPPLSPPLFGYPENHWMGRNGWKTHRLPQEPRSTPRMDRNMALHAKNLVG